MRSISGFVALLLLAATPCIALVPTSDANDSSFLENWMQNLMPVLKTSKLSDLCLPGTHDTMTYDLSTTVSDDANDLPPQVSWWLHELKDFAGMAAFVRQLSKTQGLNITEQLNAGIRFIDFRVVYTSPPNESSTAQHDWYCLHLVQSRQPALVYLKAIRDWMVAHPNEIVYMWVSRHGSTCNTTYPDTPPQAMTDFYNNITSMFSGMLFDRSLQSWNESVVGDLVATNQRLVLWASDYYQFTGSTVGAGARFSMDGCTIDNQLGPKDHRGGLSHLTVAVPDLVDELKDARARVANDTTYNYMYLRSLAGSPPHEQMLESVLIHFLPFIDKSKNEATCAAGYNIPNMTSWCPAYLQASSQLTNYYMAQIGLETAIQYDLGLPNAIYLDAVDRGGLVRTGTELFPEPGTGGNPPPSTHKTTGYAYVDTVLYYNVREACKSAAANDAACDSLLALLASRRKMNPYQRWDNPAAGRLSTFPPLPLLLSSR